MKKLLLLCLPFLMLLGCAEEKAHKTDLEFSKEGDGLVITQAVNNYEAYQKKFHVTVTVKNNGKETSENGIVKANYYDKQGDAYYETSAVIKKPLAAGDSTKVTWENGLASPAEVPYKVKLTVGDMFK